MILCNFPKESLLQLSFYHISDKKKIKRRLRRTTSTYLLLYFVEFITSTKVFWQAKYVSGEAVICIRFQFSLSPTHTTPRWKKIFGKKLASAIVRKIYHEKIGEDVIIFIFFG